MNKILFLPFLLLSFAGTTQNSQPPVTFSNPVSVSKPKGYSHAAIIDLGTSKMIIIAGQVALDSAGLLIGKGSLREQTNPVFLNIKSILKELGGDMNNIVKLNYYLRDVNQIQIVRDVRDRFINQKMPPTSTLVEVSKLFRDDILIEIEATAIIQNKK